MPLRQVIKSLEDAIAKSPLSKMGVAKGGDELFIVSTGLFARRGDMEKAKRLETALAGGLIGLEQYEDEFPDVLHMEVGVIYKLAKFSHVGEGTRLSLMQDAVLPDMYMSLCLGLRYSYVDDDDKYSGEVLFKANFSQDGTVSGIRNSLVEPPPIKVGASAVEAFRALEDYVITKAEAGS